MHHSPRTGRSDSTAVGDLAPDDDYRCAGCHYRLYGLPAGRCPECGKPFDPADRQTFRTTAEITRRRRRGRVLAATSIVAVLGAGFGGWRYGYNQIRTIESYAVCRLCGVVSVKRDEFFGNLRLWRGAPTTRENGLSKFLRVKVHSHQWEFAISFCVAPSGAAAGPPVAWGRKALANVVADGFPEPALRDVLRHFDNLASVLRRDVLGSSDSELSWWASSLLGAMCCDPSESNIQLLLKKAHECAAFQDWGSRSPAN